MAFSKDGVIFSCGQLDKYSPQYILLTITQYDMSDEVMEIRSLVILMFSDCSSECVSSTVTIATENKKLELRDDEMLSSW